MSLTAQEVVERAGVELSKCITGLGLRSRSREREVREAPLGPGGTSGGGEGGRMGSVRRGGVMEKVANVLCGNTVASSGLVNGKTKMDKPVPPEKPSRFLLGKVRNGGMPGPPLGSPAIPFNGHQGSPRPLRASRSPAHILRGHRYLSWDELIRDEAFLARFFTYFSPIERTVLAQVCLRWRTVLYQPRFWHGIRPVLNCREMRHTNVELTTDMRRRFYVSVQKRGFDSLVLMCANDEDLMDLVANYAVNHTKALRSVALRCSNISDKGLETLLDHLNGVYQLELQGCNDVTEAGLWACLNPRIVSLSVADCINVADEAVGAIAQLLPSLYELNLQAYHVTDAALAFFSPAKRPHSQSCGYTPAGNSPITPLSI
ncbi:F-box/LRR-repeat protein 16-like isoform X1 [Procambarus clarkii]|uniref:F-box/LRR-repeat protein 16-like isoform X1 n=1 Tax=Procambarus clarkii TaxID=6728 RepID=UPI001E676936|nr:F-box/LRR-repeat protein 16-like [Procambarus clarkii]